MTTRPQLAEPRQSTWLDVAAFVAALLLGIVAYFAIRTLWGKQSPGAVTIALLVLMVAYALAVRFVPRLRIRMDQAGDNCYYLGLLFTLTSMAFALYDFGALAEAGASSSGVRQIIANFGIALGTTIAGIFLRVTLHQMRVDPADLESMTRIELTEAAERLRATLEAASTNLSRFHVEIQQRSSDTTAELMALLKASADSVSTDLAEAARAILAATSNTQAEGLAATQRITGTVTLIATEAAAAVDRLRSVQPPPLALSRRLEKVGDTLEIVASQGERTSGALVSAGETLAGAANGLAATTQKLGDIVVAVEGQQANTARQLAQIVARLDGDMAPFSAGLKKVLADLGEIQAQAKQSAADSTRAHQASVELLNRLSSVVHELTSVVRSA